MTTATTEIRADLRELNVALRNVWYELRPVLITRGRSERAREVADRQGFERGLQFAAKTLSKDVQSLLGQKVAP